MIGDVAKETHLTTQLRLGIWIRHLNAPLFKMTSPPIVSTRLRQREAPKIGPQSAGCVLRSENQTSLYGLFNLLNFNSIKTHRFTDTTTEGHSETKRKLSQQEI